MNSTLKAETLVRVWNGQSFRFHQLKHDLEVEVLTKPEVPFDVKSIKDAGWVVCQTSNGSFPFVAVAAGDITL